MATFPKPLCELRVLWGERESRASRPPIRPAEVPTPVPTPRPRLEEKPARPEASGKPRETGS